MRSVWLTMVIGLALGQGVLAQAGAGDIEKTAGSLNGRGWQKLTLEGRVGYIQGYFDGATVGLVRGTPDTAGQLDAVNQAFDELFPRGVTTGEIMSAVDRFYQEPLNRRIMVPAALQVVVLEARGADRARVDGEIRRLRRQINSAEEGPVTSAPGREPAK